MGKVVKSVAKAATNAVGNIPKTFAKTTKNVGKAALGLGNAVIGKGDGNYFKNLGEAGAEGLTQAANVYTTASTAGMTSLNGSEDGGNSIDRQASAIFSKGDLPTPEAAPAMDPTEDAALKAEAENAKKKGRASTVLGGANDMGGGTSAKKTLLGSL